MLKMLLPSPASLLPGDLMGHDDERMMMLLPRPRTHRPFTPLALLPGLTSLQVTIPSLSLGAGQKAFGHDQGRGPPLSLTLLSIPLSSTSPSSLLYRATDMRTEPN